MSSPDKSDTIYTDRIVDLTELEVVRNVRRKRVMYDIWLLQGVDIEDCSQIYVSEKELDRWIEMLNNAKQVIEQDKQKEK